MIEESKRNLGSKLNFEVCFWPNPDLRIQAPAISSMYRLKSAGRQELTQPGHARFHSKPDIGPPKWAGQHPKRDQLLQLVNTAAVVRYDGLKYSDDHHDAFHLAHLMRLGILPTGYIYPKEQRAIRDLLRRRLSLVRTASAQLISAQSQLWRSTGIRIQSGELRKLELLPHW